MREDLTARRLNARLFRWHQTHRRPLVIREAGTPWEVLVAEVMSQQTGIGRVGPAWRRFVTLWPRPDSLTAATTHELLAAWAGLGYNRRALTLRDAAREIVESHAGRVPRNVAALERLPGVGPYTARAVAATAFGTPVAPLDVNVRRVVSRLTGAAPASRGLQAQADALVARSAPRRWIDAVMDLAAVVCTPASPACTVCPVAAMCATRGAEVRVARPKPTPPFPSTTRWLRGRLVSLLVDTPEGTWVAAPERLGDHDASAIAEALRSLERDGFLDLRDGSVRLRPTA